LKPRVAFRRLAKRPLFIEVPPEVLDALKGRADEEGRSYALVATEAFCRHLDLDPREFGIEAAFAPAEPTG
jgi:hypothetical protein